MKTLPARQLSSAMASGGWLALWILTSCQAFLLQGPTGPLVAQLGGSVLLPCAAESPLPLEELEVEWRRTDSGALVHLFQEGEERPESQDHVYRGRAHFVTEGFATGNYSLVLTDVTQADAGIYICKVYTDLDSGQITAEIVRIERLTVAAGGVVSAYVGDEATLNCSVDSHIPPDQLEVTWKKKHQEILVLLFEHGKIVPESTHVGYRDRVDCFAAGIPQGNFSVRLKHIRPEDKGEYVCEAHSGHLSANITTVLQGLGPPPVLVMALVLCASAFILALGLGIPSFIHLLSNVVPRRYPGYMGKEVVLVLDVVYPYEEVISVTWKRTDQIILEFKNDNVSLESSQTSHRGTVEFAEEPDEDGDWDVSLRLNNVNMSDEGEYLCEVVTSEETDTYSVALQVYNRRTVLMHCSLVLCPNIIMFIAFMLYGVKHGFGAEITTCATVNLIRFLLVFKTSPYLEILPACPKKYIKGIGIMLQYLITAGVLFSGVFADISVIGVNTFFLLFFTGMQLFYYIWDILTGGIDRLEYWCFTYVDIMNWILLWLLVVGYSTFSFRMFIITLAFTLGVDVLFNLQQLDQYEKFYAVSTILIIVFFPVCIGAFFYYLYWIIGSKPEGPGLMCGSALLYSLTAASGFNHPDTTTDIPLPHITVYMFGAAALAVINAVTLATELITIMVTGARMCSDLQVIVLSSECVFVCGWIALQLYHYWIRKREIIKEQLRDISKKLRCKDVKSQDS
ncbi:hypothetical protein ACEWY4_016040 [Coilia grayii]|uniref:Ig-like domain-containing protein n=1 Tax=Coilia grayii TaxID=363190 RepID=A0ABD1JQK0_9TELE